MSETPPPGFLTSTRRLPRLLTRLAGTSDVNCVALIKVVARLELPIWTVHPETNPVPLIVSVKPPLPTIDELGLSEVITGFGGPIVKLTPLEVIPPDSTLTVAVPADAIKFDGTEAVNWVTFAKLVATADPFH